MAQVISLQPEDDLAVLRYRLRGARNGRVVVVLPWETRLFSRPLDGELVRREAERLGLEVAIVSEDPDRRARVRWSGLPAFASVAEAEAAPEWPWPEQELPEPPPRAFWEEEIPLRPPPARPLPPWARNLRLGARIAVFLATLLVLAAFAYAVVPRATVTLVPRSRTVRAEVTLSAGLDFSGVDPARGLIPARRVGDYFSGYLEVETTGTAARESGKARGTVLVTNLLAQEVRIPVGTVVRTSAGSFPVRFATTEEVVVPPFGQASVPIEALEEGPAGNVPAGHINQIEGLFGAALRVINPEPTSGGGLQEVRAVSQEDMDRAREQLTARLLDEAYQGLQRYLEPTEVLLRNSLEIQAQEVTFNRFLYEQADTVGVQMRLLITGMAVDRGDAQVVAYRALTDRLPPGHALVRADFEWHEPAEGPRNGVISFSISAVGHAAAEVDPEAVRRAIRGRPVPGATALLVEEFPLAEEPRIEVWPRWPGRLPLLPLRIEVVVRPQGAN